MQSRDSFDRSSVGRRVSQDISDGHQQILHQCPRYRTTRRKDVVPRAARGTVVMPPRTSTSPAPGESWVTNGSTLSARHRRTEFAGGEAGTARLERRMSNQLTRSRPQSAPVGGRAHTRQARQVPGSLASGDAGQNGGEGEHRLQNGQRVGFKPFRAFAW